MSQEPRAVLSTGDFFLLESARFEHRESLPDLSRKLDTAIVTFPADIPADVVTTGRSVTYRIGEEPATERTISSTPAGPSELALLSPLGVALVGLSAGQSVPIRLEDGGYVELTVERVSEPEPEIAVPDRALEEGSRVLSFQARRPAAAARPRIIELDDDPGPSAA